MLHIVGQVIQIGFVASRQNDGRDAGTRCSYRGSFSGTVKGVLDCSDAKGVPLELSIR